MNEAKQATPHSVLIEQLMDSRIPKTEREHAARREIEMLREALRLPAQQAAEPVAWMYDFLDSSDRENVIRDWVTQSQDDITREKGFNVRSLYTAPRQWVGLTDEEIVEALGATQYDSLEIHRVRNVIEAFMEKQQ